MPFPGKVAMSETVLVSSRVWTQIVDFIPGGDNRNAMLYGGYLSLLKWWYEKLFL